MAETLAEKLKRLAAEKKAAQAVAPASETVNVQPMVNQPQVTEDKLENPYGTPKMSEVRGTDGQDPEPASVDNCTGGGEGQATSQLVQVETELPSVSGSISTKSGSLAPLAPTPTNHPLAMQFAEMEQALLGTDPRFKTILRDVHRHLGQDPDLVTLMTEAEVALVVRGLVTFANAEIVAPAKAKAVRAATKNVKNISADDL